MPGVVLTFTSGSVMSIGTIVVPCAPLEFWYSTVCRPVPETTGAAFAMKDAPSTLEVIPSPPVIVTVVAAVYHPFVGVPLRVAEIPGVTAGGVTGSMCALLLITPTLPNASTAWMNHSAAEPANGPPPLQRVDPATWDRSIDRHAPDPSLYSATTRFTASASAPSPSSTSTAKPTVDGLVANARTGPN